MEQVSEKYYKTLISDYTEKSKSEVPFLKNEREVILAKKKSLKEEGFHLTYENFNKNGIIIQISYEPLDPFKYTPFINYKFVKSNKSIYFLLFIKGDEKIIYSSTKLEELTTLIKMQM